MMALLTAWVGAGERKRAGSGVPLFALLASLLLARGATQPNCATYQDNVGATFKHTASRMAPCDGKEQRTPCRLACSLLLSCFPFPGSAYLDAVPRSTLCRYYLNLTHPNGEFHTRNMPVVSGHGMSCSVRGRVPLFYARPCV